MSHSPTLGEVSSPAAEDAAPASRRQSAYAWLCGLVTLIGAAMMAYSQTRAFTWDEGFHLLAAQLIAAGKKPYMDFCFPQTPLNVYWNAAWMRLLGETWRVPHALSALLAAGGAMLAADFVFTRIPAPRWRLPAAMTAALVTGLNLPVFTHGVTGQAYGMCVFTTVAAFRFSVVAIRKPRAWAAALAGLLAGAAAASSLLTAAAAPALLVWIALHNRAGNRWTKSAAFVCGAAAPFLTVFLLLIEAPRQTWFNLVQYQVAFRSATWPDATQNDVEILISWIDSGQALLLGLLAAAGALFVRAGKDWSPAQRAEYLLSGWLALAIGLEVSLAHPTFSRYFLLLVPFLAILAAAGLCGAASRLAESARPAWSALVLGALVCLGLAKGLDDRSDVYTWSQIQDLARKTAEVTPAQAPLWADENVYFLTRRTPLPGMEFSYSHAIESLPAGRAAELHILPNSEIRRRVAAGAYATIETCDDDTDFIQSLDLTKLYRQRADVWGCAVYWDKIR
ncbi:MAG: hypothetical protein ABSC23_02990 [Bryobacteraceae bacterium]